MSNIENNNINKPNTDVSKEALGGQDTTIVKQL